ncbi:hypothetical protein LDG_8397 [Legionella drancourtii LLAP12]|uniref:Uncharacterized protein n=1 Tax=Legionella drancourtii LLAP12 TaxID=658187 RepID=G9ESX0_9GAMM|nr:hypothetical protein LDG_8397 [Legionella drancourtii LLAP12]
MEHGPVASETTTDTLDAVAPVLPVAATTFPRLFTITNCPFVGPTAKAAPEASNATASVDFKNVRFVASIFNTILLYYLNN